jgi:hypothetical protein
MQDKQSVETLFATSLRSMIDLLEEREKIFPWEAAFSLKIKTSEALEILSVLVDQGKVAALTVKSTVKECTGFGCINCDCTNSYEKNETKYRIV